MIRLKEAINTIDKDEFTTFYNLNSNRITRDKYNMSTYVLNRYLEYLDITPHSQAKNLELTCLSKYGKPNAYTEESLRKYKQTCINKYGSLENYHNHIIEAMKNTCLEKYGCEFSAQSDTVKQKHIKHNLEKYGVENYFCTNEFKEKFKNTCLERYGVESYSKYPGRNERVKNTIIKNYGTWDNYVNSISNSIKNTCLQKYGVESASKLVSTKEKEYITKAKNNSFNLSKSEDNFYEKLLQFFNEEDIVRQYFDIDRYPFKCDFYIKSKDLFIECNYNWTHGGQPFDDTDEKCIVKLNTWLEKSKNSDFYKNAIYQWTDLDVRKRKFAEDNNLNYITLYDKEEEFIYEY